MMRNKILSYILVGVFAVLLGSVGYSFATCYEDFTRCQSICGVTFSYCLTQPSSTTCLERNVSCNNTCINNKKSCDECHGIKLNTNFPIIGSCIEINGAETNPTNAFPYMIGVLTKIVMSVILVICFIFIIWAGILRSADKPDPAKKMLKRVAITILLLGFSGVILKLVNPNFFY